MLTEFGTHQRLGSCVRVIRYEIDTFGFFVPVFMSKNVTVSVSTEVFIKIYRIHSMNIW